MGSSAVGPAGDAASRGAKDAGCIAPTYFIDCDDPTVVRYAGEVAAGAADDPEKARRLYRAVRDDIRYDPYRVSEDPAEMRASRVLAVREGFCVPKAVLLAACARSQGIPARLCFANVVNHLSSPKLRARMQTDVFYYHGYNELWLEGRWVKVTPTFNRELCDRVGVRTLEFDGQSDAILQPYDRGGRQYMEYVADHGCFEDLPFDLLLTTWKHHYPALFADTGCDRVADRVFGSGP